MKRAVVVLLLFVICSCSKIMESDIPYAPVWFELDLRYSDKDLVPLLGYKEITSPRVAGEKTGYAGLLIVHSYDDVFMAYDLCCPNEAKKSIVIVPGNNDGTATCPSCKTVYDIGNGGVPVSGPSKFALRRYNVTQSGETIQIHN